MEKTGERFLPEFDADWTLEHTHRYLLASELAQGKEVLDIACGDGYGSDMLAGSAKSVLGVDICPETIARAQSKYQRPNLRYEQGSILEIPLPDASVDMVVSFETLEHLGDQDGQLSELRRVLRPGGLLVISTPDKHQFTEVIGHANTFHVKELYRHEFETLLGRYFAHFSLLGQSLVYGSVIGSEQGQAQPFLSWRKHEPDSRHVGLLDATYLIALASDGPLPELPSSVMQAKLEHSDHVRLLQERWAHEEFVLKEAQARAEGERDALQAQILNINEHRAAMQAALDEKQTALDAVRAELEVTKVDLAGVRENYGVCAARCQIAEQTLNHVYKSKSWRLTAPLRALVAMLQGRPR